MTVALDPASASIHAVITGGVTLSANASFTSGARGDTIRTAGKFWFEVFCTNPIIFGTAVPGLTGATLPDYTTLLASATGGLTIDRNGFVTIDGVGFGAVIFTPATYVTFLIDLDNNLCWIHGSAGWNNSPVFDPTTPTGGFDISSIASGGIYPVGIVSDASRALSFNFGANTPVNTPPSIFSPWDTTPPPPPPPVVHHLFQNIRTFGFGSRFTATSAGEPTGIVMRSINIAATEPSDVLAASVGNTVGVTAAVTEPDDVFAADATTLPPANFDDGEVIFVPPEYGFRVPAEPSSPFVIPFEDRVLVVPLLDL